MTGGTDIKATVLPAGVSAKNTVSAGRGEAPKSKVPSSRPYAAATVPPRRSQGEGSSSSRPQGTKRAYEGSSRDSAKKPSQANSDTLCYNSTINGGYMRCNRNGGRLFHRIITRRREFTSNSRFIHMALTTIQSRYRDHPF